VQEKSHAIVAHGVRWCPKGRLVFAPLQRRGQPALGAIRLKGELRERYSSSTACSRGSPSGAPERRTLSGGEQQMLAIGRALMKRAAPAPPG